MSIFSNRCKFLCPQAGSSTTSLRVALEWEFMGFDVLFYYNGKYVGKVVNGGEIDTLDDFPDDAPAGAVFYCHELNGFFFNIPENVLKSKPLVLPKSVTYSMVFMS